jgi:glycerophosphoryl diester phosphodiesterase
MILRTEVPGVPVGLLTYKGYPLREAIPAAVHLGAEVVAVHVASFGLETDTPPYERDISESVRVAHEAGLQVIAWCPGPGEGDRLVAAGVDCLVIDDVPTATVHFQASRARAPGGPRLKQARRSAKGDARP